MNNFEQAAAIVMMNEGGLVTDPDDPGGTTNYGISQRAYPTLDIPSLTMEGAKAIYLNDYWKFNGLVDQGIATKLLDMSVNLGPATAIKILQQALDPMFGNVIEADGIFGPETLGYTNKAPADKLMRELRARVAMHYSALIVANSTLQKFALGWFRRAVR